MSDYIRMLNSETINHELLAEVRNGIIDEHDKFLIDNFGVVFDTFKSFNDWDQENSLENIRFMADEMLYFLVHEIKDFNDLDRYRAAVGGSVGDYLTRLVKSKDGIELSLFQAFRFGMYLQGFNIIRDVWKDAKEGRIYWPKVEVLHGKNLLALIEDRDNPQAKRERLEMLEKMVEEVKKDCKPTFEYIASIPEDVMPGYRRFCGTIALMGKETLDVVRGNDDVFYKNVKISRPTKLGILFTTWLGVPNKRLRYYCTN